MQNKANFAPNGCQNLGQIVFNRRTLTGRVANRFKKGDPQPTFRDVVGTKAKDGRTYGRTQTGQIIKYSA